jgi:hypothetical protein
MNQTSDLLFILTSPRIGARRELEIQQVLGDVDGNKKRTQV